MIRMTDELESISLGGVFWIQFKKDRLSFRTAEIPEDIHFTISWHENNSKINLHVTRNVPDGNNKPKIVIAEMEKHVAATIMNFLPTAIFHHLFTPVYFKSYSRKSRKNIKLCFYDDMEKHQARTLLEKEFTKTFRDASLTKRKKLKIDLAAATTLLPVLQSPEMRSIFLDNLRNLTLHSFYSALPRAGIIFMGKRSLQFLSVRGNCYLLKEKITASALLASFMTPELAKGVTGKIQKAITTLQTAETFSDTIPFNNPYQLFIENAG